MSDSLPDMRLAQAVLNNTRWCSTVCGSHGDPGEFSAELWLHRQPTPRFYPNAVTLTPATVLGDSLARTLPTTGGVKDSFCTLDLAVAGFQALFTAQWIWRTPEQPSPERVDSGLQWGIVQTEQALAAWEAAWNGPPTPDAPALPRLFLPSLLTDVDITFLAAYQGEQIVAGAIGNRTDGVVGVSNLFYPAQAAHTVWAECIAQLTQRHPTLPLVGYERDEDLTIAQSLGFAAIGPLRVWVRP